MRDKRAAVYVLAAITALVMAVVAAPAGAATQSSAEDEYTLDTPGNGSGSNAISPGDKNGGSGSGANASGKDGKRGKNGELINGKRAGSGVNGAGAANTRGVGDIASDSSSNTGIILLLIALVAIAGAGAVFVIRRRRAATHTD